MFFVSVDSKKFSVSVNSLFSTLTSKSTSVDSKGLAWCQNSAEMGCFSFVFKRIKKGYPQARSNSSANREGAQAIAQVYLSVIIPPGY